MPLITLDGLENDDSAIYNRGAGTAYVAGRTGSGMSSSNSYISWETVPNAGLGTSAGSTYTWIVFGAAMRLTDLVGAPKMLLSIQGVNQVQLMLRVNADGSLQVVRAPSGTAITGATSAPGVLQVGSWAYVEMKCTPHATAGAATVRVNNTIVIDVSGVNTTHTSVPETTISGIYVGSSSGSSGASLTIDDVYLCAATSNSDPFLGDLVVEHLFANGDGAVNQWLGSDGNSVSNYLLVDEPGNYTASDYVKDSVVGHQELYAMGNLSTVSGTVLGVLHLPLLMKTDSGAAAIKLLNRGGGGTITKSATISNLSSSGYQAFGYVLSVNPDTGAPWTIAEVNALQSGIEIA